MGKIVQNVKFLPVSQNNDLSSKSNSIHQNESRDVLGFQNKVLETYKPKWHAKRSMRLTLKMNFSIVALLETLRSPMDL